MDYDIEENILYVFTDGASRSVFNDTLGRKTGRYGGKGMVIVYYDKDFNLKTEKEGDSTAHVGATNNDMELEASIDALKTILYRDMEDFKKAIIVTDSTFVKDGAYRAERIWPKTKRFGTSGEPIKHVDRRKQLVKYKKKIYDKHRKIVEFNKVQAHDGNEFNETADQLAVAGAMSKKRRPGTTTIPRAKFLQSMPGRFEVAGQKLFIHVIGTTRFRKQKINKYKYEVVSCDSPYFKMTNDMYYEGYLSAEKIYEVEFGEDEKACFVVDVISTEEKEDIRKKIIDAGFEEDVFYKRKRKKSK